MTEQKRPPTAQEFVLAQLRKAIASREIKPGEAIRQDALAERYGTSRVPLREALKILEGEGQVTYHPHRGYFVTELSVADLVEVYRMRELLESEAIRAAVPRLAADDLAMLKSALVRVERAGAAGDVAAMTSANRDFHFLLFDAAERPRLSRVISQLWEMTDAYRAIYYAEPKNRKQVDREHRAILKALSAKDVKLAVALHAEHRAHAVARLQQHLTD